MNEEEFKNKHGGYDSYELAIHRRGFGLGVIGGIFLSVVILIGYFMFI